MVCREGFPPIVPARLFLRGILGFFIECRLLVRSMDSYFQEFGRLSGLDVEASFFAYLGNYSYFLYRKLWLFGFFIGYCSFRGEVMLLGLRSFDNVFSIFYYGMAEDSQRAAVLRFYTFGSCLCSVAFDLLYRDLSLLFGWPVVLVLFRSR